MRLFSHQLVSLLFFSVALLKQSFLLLNFHLVLIALLPKTSLLLLFGSPLLFQLIAHLLHLLILLLKSLLILCLLLGHVFFELVQLLFELTFHVCHRLQLVLLGILRRWWLDLRISDVVAQIVWGLQRLCLSSRRVHILLNAYGLLLL